MIPLDFKKWFCEGVVVQEIVIITKPKIESSHCAFRRSVTPKHEDKIRRQLQGEELKIGEGVKL